MVTVELPASSEVGTKRGAIDFEWDDGRRLSWPIAWKVVPIASAQPDALRSAASPDPVRRTVLIRADRPFRIVATAGACPSPPSRLPTPDRLLHTLTLDIDAREPGFRDIVVTTDHPDQAEVPISLHVHAGRGDGS